MIDVLDDTVLADARRGKPEMWIQAHIYARYSGSGAERKCCQVNGAFSKVFVSNSGAYTAHRAAPSSDSAPAYN